jgi:hypothetical protein
MSLFPVSIQKLRRVSEDRNKITLPSQHSKLYTLQYCVPVHRIRVKFYTAGTYFSFFYRTFWVCFLSVSLFVRLMYTMTNFWLSLCGTYGPTKRSRVEMRNDFRFLNHSDENNGKPQERMILFLQDQYIFLVAAFIKMPVWCKDKLKLVGVWVMSRRRWWNGVECE